VPFVVPILVFEKIRNSRQFPDSSQPVAKRGTNGATKARGYRAFWHFQESHTVPRQFPASSQPVTRRGTNGTTKARGYRAFGADVAQKCNQSARLPRTLVALLWHMVHFCCTFVALL